MDPYREAAGRPPFEVERPFFPRVGDIIRIPNPVPVLDYYVAGSLRWVSRIGYVSEIFPNGIYAVAFGHGLPRTGLYFITELFDPMREIAYQ